MLYVDDAHGEGVLGEGGRGIVSHYHLSHEQVHIEMGTFSKAYGVVGGHISGSEDLVRFALNKSRTWLLSGSHPPAVAAACIAAIDVLEQEPEHVISLWKNTNYFKKAMKELGFDIGRSETPITPVMVGDSSCGQAAEPKAVRGAGLRSADRVPDGGQGQGEDPDDNERHLDHGGPGFRHREVLRHRQGAEVDQIERTECNAITGQISVSGDAGTSIASSTYSGRLSGSSIPMTLGRKNAVTPISAMGIPAIRNQV